MKLLQYVAAYMSLSVLMKAEFPYKSAYELVKLKRRLAPKAEFYGAEERKLVKRFAKCDQNGEPVISDARFDCRGKDEAEVAANAREFERLRRELGAVEDEEPFEKVIIKLPDDIKISPEVIEFLEPFVIFEVSE